MKQILRTDEESDRQIHVRLPEELYRYLKVRAAQEDTTIQALVSRLVREEQGRYAEGTLRRGSKDGR